MDASRLPHDAGPQLPAGPALPMADTCCPPAAPVGGTPCCVPDSGANGDLPGYRMWPFVEGWLDTPAVRVPRVHTRLGPSDLLGRWAMRWGIGRDRYRIAPGLYAVGRPEPASPVLVTANYKMTFDLLRRDLDGVDAWILVLETRGINVWCAAGKGTFGTAELARRVTIAGLDKVVSHRTLVLPQLGAVGVAAHEVRRLCGFSVVYGPIRSQDLKAFLSAGMEATPEMRRVRFPLEDRIALTPVELRGMLGRPGLAAVLALVVLGGLGPGVFSPAAVLTRGLGAAAAALVGVLAGAVATPILLPWLPGRAFSIKGATTGATAAVALIAAWPGALGAWNGLAILLAVPATSSYCAMNFTGSTPFTSPSGVEREMRRAIPWQAAATATAGVAWIAGAFAV